MGVSENGVYDLPQFLAILTGKYWKKAIWFRIWPCVPRRFLPLATAVLRNTWRGWLSWNAHKFTAQIALHRQRGGFGGLVAARPFGLTKCSEYDALHPTVFHFLVEMLFLCFSLLFVSLWGIMMIGLRWESKLVIAVPLKTLPFSFCFFSQYTPPAHHHRHAFKRMH